MGDDVVGGGDEDARAGAGAGVADDAMRSALLGLRLTSFAPTERVAAVVGLDPEVASRALAVAADEGWAKHREGRLTGWVLTPAGRAEGERRLTAELDGLGTREAVHAAYERFLALNGTCLQVCTDWQVRTDGEAQVVNDHADAAYDAAVVASLGRLHDAVRPVLADLAGVLDRFAGYEPRFASARRLVEGGQPEWFTKPDIDSFHTVWFELHEHLLATLGIERRSETAG